mmetsp:Transcript_21038/g.54957  ORF Transcript_21038/g.54957 Transcript_21038/m.54957 type:complete len:143 (+) Transcript_21038:136-564(+)
MGHYQWVFLADDTSAGIGAPLLAVRLLGRWEATVWVRAEQSGGVLAFRDLELSAYDAEHGVWAADAGELASWQVMDAGGKGPRGGLCRTPPPPGRLGGAPAAAGQPLALGSAAATVLEWAARNAGLIEQQVARVEGIVNRRP